MIENQYGSQHVLRAPDRYSTSVLPGWKVTVTARPQSAGRVGKLHDQPGAAIPDTPQEEWRPLQGEAEMLILPIGRWRIEAMAGSLVVEAVPL